MFGVYHIWSVRYKEQFVLYVIFFWKQTTKAHVTKHLRNVCFDVGERTGSDESVGTCGNPFVTTRGRQCVTYDAETVLEKEIM